MINIFFFKRQLLQIKQEGFFAYWRNVWGVRRILMVPLYILAFPLVVVIRMIGPWFLVRMGGLISLRIGHFAANTELYLCERKALINVPKQRYIDLFHMAYRPICNHQLAIMWKRVLHIWPSWVLAPLLLVNRMIAGGAVHVISDNTQGDRDVHNLLDRFPPHLEFSTEEVVSGEAGLHAMGIPKDSRFVCLIVRDSAYLDTISLYDQLEMSYHNYRDCDIQNYVLAAKELADRGYYVIRMGVKVKAAMKTEHKRIIDYAVNGMRSDFMDIYLGAKCEFCISVGTGFDAVPFVFRRPIVYTNHVPLGYLSTFSWQFLAITKHYYDVSEDRKLTLREIFERGTGFNYASSNYKYQGIKLIENTPDEICAVVIEMADRLSGTWQPCEDDEDLQSRFWEIFPSDTLKVNNGRPLHGEIRSRFGAQFLRDNRDWLR
jgi:putative glycosyltransferase (TIGR04372 family)